MKRSRSCNQGVTTRSGLENDAGGRPLGEGEKEEMRCEIFHCLEESRFFQKNYMRVEVVKLLRMGLVFARRWREQAVDILPTERLKLRRQMAAAAGRKESVS